MANEQQSNANTKERLGLKHFNLSDPTPPQFVYIYTSIPYSYIFSKGLGAGSNSPNFIQHLNGQPCITFRDGFITATSRLDLLQLEARNYLGSLNLPDTFYIYRVRADSNFYNSQITLQHLMDYQPALLNSFANATLQAALLQRESEYVVPSYIPGSNIQSVDVYSGDRSGITPVVSYSNDNYQPDSTTANQEPYTGNDNYPAQNLGPAAIGNREPTLGACLLANAEQDEDFFPFKAVYMNALSR